jgi:copper(I)-binding protein
MPVDRKNQASLFMVIHNNGGVPDKLLDVKSDMFGKAVLHTGSKQILAPHGIMIPGHATAILEPDRPFVALQEIKANGVGSDYELRLIFEKVGEVTIKAVVEPTDADRGRDKGPAND